MAVTTRCWLTPPSAEWVPSGTSGASVTISTSAGRQDSSRSSARRSDGHGTAPGWTNRSRR
ncbi:MAG: hypothetical protein ACM32E_21270 [Gemmatimonadota bacterium]